MPRPKGSKNKAKVTIPANDFDTLIAEKTSAKENLTVEIGKCFKRRRSAISSTN